MKRFLCVLMMLAMLCSTALAEGASLQDRALELAQKVISVACDKRTMETMTNDHEMLERIGRVAEGDYSRPVLVAKADFTETTAFMRENGILPADEYELSEFLRWRVADILPHLALGRSGDVMAIALSGITAMPTVFADATELATIGLTFVEVAK